MSVGSPGHSIAARAATGAAWNTAASVSTRTLGLLGTLAITHFVVPSEYGEYTVGVTCVFTASRFFTFGLGPYVIAVRPEPEQTFHAFVCHLGAIFFAVSGVVVLRGPLGVLLGAPDMGRFVPWLALATLITHVSHIPSATLFRELRFRVVAVSRALGDLAFTAVSVGLAPFWGAPALVAGTIARAIVVSSLLIARSDRSAWFRPTNLTWRTTREMLGFSLPVYLSSLAETLSSWDKLLISRLFGTGVAGQYSLAFSLADTPASQVGDQIGDVLLPSFAMMERKQRAAGLRRAAALMGLIVFPLAGGLAAVSSTLVKTVLQPRWAGVAPMLVILCLVSILRPLSWALEAYLQAQRRPRALMFLGLLRIVGILGFLLSLGRLGLLWACGAVVLGFAWYVAGCLFVVRRAEGISPGRFLGAVLPPLIATIIMGAGVLVVRALLRQAGFDSGWPLLISEIACGGTVYVGAAWLIARDTTDDLIGLVQQLWNRLRTRPESA